MLAGLAIGFATATKFSAMPLFVPLGVAALIRPPRERRSLVASAGRCWRCVCGGVRVLRRRAVRADRLREFYRDIFEQSRMVRNAGVYPYTNQYMAHAEVRATTSTQLVLWGMAPPLGAGGGVGLRRRAWRWRGASAAPRSGCCSPG